MREIRVLIVGPSRLARSAVAARLRNGTSPVRVVAEARTPEAAVLLTRRHEPHLVVLLDGGHDEAGAVRAATARAPKVVLVPDRPLPESDMTPNVLVLPRSKYTVQAMTMALARVIATI